MSLGGMRLDSSIAATFSHFLNAVSNAGWVVICSRFICASAVALSWQSKQNFLRIAAEAPNADGPSPPEAMPGTTTGSAHSTRHASRRAKWERRGTAGFLGGNKQYVACKGLRPDFLPVFIF